MADRKIDNKAQAQTQAMPHDSKKGSPDGVNSQGERHASGGSDDAAPYPNPHTGTDKPGKKHKLADGFMSHGGQSDMDYHGSGQLGKEKTRPGGNANSGARED